MSSANGGSNDNNELNSVSALAASDGWAVGDYETGTGAGPFQRFPQAQHWDGGSWTPTATAPAVPPLSTGDNVLLSVAEVSSSSVWAVGFTKPDNNTGTLRHVLIEHWDGSTWSIVPANDPGGTSNALFGIKAASATDIWAVGQARGSTSGSPLIEHYDGTNWTASTITNLVTNADLSDVLPLSATDVWAAGSAGNSVLIEHYDGSSWSQKGPGAGVSVGPTPVLSQYLNDIAGVAGDIWAVGGQADSSTTSKTLAMHYDGTGWTEVGSPSPNLSANLVGVRYTAANDVWAVGSSAYASPGTIDELDNTLIEHWDGQSWRQVISPNPSNHDALFDLALAGSNLLLAVGFSQDAIGGAASQTLSAALCEPVPAVTGFSPDHGNSAGGTVVTITGTGLAFPRSVSFGSVASPNFVASSDTQITAVAPAQAPGTVVPITVSSMGGTPQRGGGAGYTYFGPGAWDDAGGVLASGPTASTGGVGSIDAYVAGTDGILYHRFLGSGGTGWEALPGLRVTSDASSVSSGGSSDVFVRGADNALWHHVVNNAGGTTSAWIRIGGALASAPAATSVGGGTIAVFVQGTDNHLWLMTLGAGGPAWRLAGGVLASGPSAVSMAAGIGDAFVMGVDTALWHWSSAGNGTWTGLGGRLLGKPAATVRGGTTLDVFVEGADTGLWHWTSGAGGSWEGLGGKLGAAPAAVSWAGSRLDVLVRGTDAALYHSWQDGSAAITTWRWEGLGGKMTGSPVVVTWGPNRLDAFVRGTDNHLWHLPFD